MSSSTSSLPCLEVLPTPLSLPDSLAIMTFGYGRGIETKQYTCADIVEGKHKLVEFYTFHFLMKVILMSYTLTF